MTQSLNEKFIQFPESQKGKHLLFWLSLAAVGLTVVSALRRIGK